MNAFMPKYSKLMFFSTRAEDVAQLFTAAELFFSGTKTPQHHRLGSRVDWPNWDRIKSLCWFQPNRALHFDSFTIRQDLINQKSVPHSRHTQSGPIILYFFWGSHDLFASLQTERCAWTWNDFRCGLLATHQAISHRYTATDVREKLERVAKSHKVERFWAFFFLHWALDTANGQSCHFVKWLYVHVRTCTCSVTKRTLCSDAQNGTNWSMRVHACRGSAVWGGGCLYFLFTKSHVDSNSCSSIHWNAL